MENHPWFRQLSDDEWVEDIHIRTVPRLKESELSGDEWRTSAVVEFSRKGRVVKTESYHDIRNALVSIVKYAGLGGMYPGNLGVMGDVTTELVENFCMQPGCSEPWTTEYKMTTEGCGHCGNRKDLTAQSYSNHRRRFCDRHKYRGDSDLDDSDDNYTLVEAEPTADDDSQQ